MNSDAAVIIAIIMVFAIFLGARILLWYLDRKDRLEDRYIISREHNPPDIEFADLGPCGFRTEKSGTLITMKEIRDNFSTKKEDDLE